MKKLILFFLLLASVPALAQSELKFGYLSYNAVLQAMPEYTAMQNGQTAISAVEDADRSWLTAHLSSFIFHRCSCAITVAVMSSPSEGFSQRATFSSILTMKA